MLSIIIPTHNRLQYLKTTISYLLSISNDIEIVISDSSPWQSTKLTESTHNRVKYVNSPTNCSVVENFNFAYNQSSGDYILFIGDDDSLSTHIAEIYTWLKINSHIDTVTFKFPVHYYWPDFQHRNKNIDIAGKLNIINFTGEVIKINNLNARNEALHKCGSGPVNMPRIYCGIVSRQICDRIILNHGSLFGGVSPDVYSSCLISFYAQNTYNIDFPIVIPGLSGKSTSGQSANGSHLSKLKDNDHLKPFINLNWNPLIPEFYSVQTVWSYSLIEATKQINIPNKNINIEAVYVRSFIRNPTYSTYTIKAIKRRIKETSLFRFFLHFTKNLYLEIKSSFYLLLSRRKKFNNLTDNYTGDFSDITEAMRFLNNETKDRKILFP